VDISKKRGRGPAALNETIIGGPTYMRDSSARRLVSEGKCMDFWGKKGKRKDCLEGGGKKLVPTPMGGPI